MKEWGEQKLEVENHKASEIACKKNGRHGVHGENLTTFKVFSLNYISVIRCYINLNTSSKLNVLLL